MSGDKVGIRGFFRVNITEDGKIVGDSGWLENQITNEGFRNIARLIGGITGSTAVSHLALGTGGVPATGDTSLSGEVVKRAAVTAATSSTSKAVLFTGTFSSSNSFVTSTQNISNIGLFPASSASTLIAGNTFASSSCATNQDVNCSYTLTLA